ncbi:hypothetical protein [Ignicoccus hospitalis]|uniref:Polymerase nucleotidyl transferase domain-containing protein n=1 Tax=Ignicoccus hospitalis (strain KIN4/I / DSM 18386 / JCM 14125) TaxID=453591 RepID=A8AAL3_IGNH4|nr:hypothetical protein [Ignicoccus hospitalis]ABU81965.1 hypothetical protein Igni_0783 [Ignicoccus hospitalis KIN4/I]HIH89876.1 hypothetical protein [Desulfurococcaceae archaeon]
MWPLEDKRLLVLKDSIAVVVGYEHPPGCYVAYRKYAVGAGPWRGFRRLVKEYSPVSVLKGRRVYDPNFGSEVPLVCADEVVEAPDPLKRFEEVLSAPKDELEYKVLKFSKFLSGRVGLGGSLLLKIHHDLSDVDLLIYSDPVAAWENLKNNETLEPETSWVVNVSRRLGMPISTAKRLYSKALRARFDGTPISFSYVKRSFERYGASAATFVGSFVGELFLDPLDERAFYYPHRRRAGEVVVESYESAFLKVLVECERVKVKGALYVKPDGTKIVRVGIKEVGGYVLPARPCRL